MIKITFISGSILTPKVVLCLLSIQKPKALSKVLFGLVMISKSILCNLQTLQMIKISKPNTFSLKFPGVRSIAFKSIYVYNKSASNLQFYARDSGYMRCFIQGLLQLERTFLRVVKLETAAA